GVHPVRHAGVLGRDHDAQHAVGVEVGLGVVEARMVVDPVGGLVDPVGQDQGAVEALLRRLHLDDQGLVLGQVVGALVIELARQPICETWTPLSLLTEPRRRGCWTWSTNSSAMKSTAAGGRRSCASSSAGAGGGRDTGGSSRSMETVGCASPAQSAPTIRIRS